MFLQIKTFPNRQLHQSLSTHKISKCYVPRRSYISIYTYPYARADFFSSDFYASPKSDWVERGWTLVASPLLARQFSYARVTDDVYTETDNSTEAVKTIVFANLYP